MEKWKGAYGFLEQGDVDVLRQLGKDAVCLEIGSFHGRSTLALSSVSSMVYTIDTHKADGTGQTQTDGITSLESFKDNTEEGTNIQAYVDMSKNVIPTFEDNFFDLVFIDGDHGFFGTDGDLIASWPKVKMGAKIAFHDYLAWLGVTETVHAHFKEDEINRAKDSCVCWVTKTTLNLPSVSCNCNDCVQSRAIRDRMLGLNK